MKKFMLLMVILAILITGCKKDKPDVDSGEVAKFKFAWSHYTGWEPWGYADAEGIIDKWAKKYNIEISVDLINDYIESINLYTAGEYDACTMTNMDALTIPAVGGVSSECLIIGDFSNGNDGIVVKNGSSVSDLKGRTVKLVELSVSHYMLARALELHNLKESDLTVVNTSDADIGSIFVSDTDEKAAVVTWNPILMQVVKVPDATLIFDSSQLPGEIIDMTVVKSECDERFKKALVGAWYETMEVLDPAHPQYENAIKYMADNSGATPDEFKAQVETTAMFYAPNKAVEFTISGQLKDTMEYVRTFSFDHGLYGEGADSSDYVGIKFPDNSVMGDAGNVNLIFDESYMEMAQNNKL